MTTGTNQLIEAVPIIDEDIKSTTTVSANALPREAHFEKGDKCQMEITIGNGTTWEHFTIRDLQHKNGRWQYKLNYPSGQPYGSRWYAEHLLQDD